MIHNTDSKISILILSTILLTGLTAAEYFDEEETLSTLEENNDIDLDDPGVEVEDTSPGITTIYEGDGSIDNINIEQDTNSITVSTEEGICGAAEVVLESSDGIPLFSEGFVTNHEGYIGESVEGGIGIGLADADVTFQEEGEFGDLETFDAEAAELLEHVGPENDYWFFNIVMEDISDCGNEESTKEITLNGLKPGACTEFRANSEANQYVEDGEVSTEGHMEAIEDYNNGDIDAETLLDVHYAWTYDCEIEDLPTDINFDYSPEEVEEDGDITVTIDVLRDGEIVEQELEYLALFTQNDEFTEIETDTEEFPVEQTDPVFEDPGNELEAYLAIEGQEDDLVDSSGFEVVESQESDEEEELTCEVGEEDIVIYYNEDRGEITSSELQQAQSDFNNGQITQEQLEKVQYANENDCDISEDTEERDVEINSAGWSPSGELDLEFENMDSEVFVGNAWLRPGEDVDVNWIGKRSDVRVLPGETVTVEKEDVPEGDYDINIETWNGVYHFEGDRVFSEPLKLSEAGTSDETFSMSIEEDSIEVGESFTVMVTGEDGDEQEVDGELTSYINNEELEQGSETISTETETVREASLTSQMEDFLEEDGYFDLRFEFEPEVNDQTLESQVRIESSKETFDLELTEGWNMVSAPGAINTNDVGDRCNLSSIDGTTYWTLNDESNGWGSTSLLEPVYGMYVYSDEECDTEVPYTETEISSVELDEGWNLISTVEENALTELSHTCNFEQFQGSEVWHLYDNEWETGDTTDPLPPEIGVMVQAESSCEIELQETEPPTPTGLFHGGEQ